MNKTSKILAVLGFALALGGTTVSRADVPPPDAGETDAATAEDAATEDDAATAEDDAATPADDAATPAADASTAADSGTTTPAPEEDDGCSVAGAGSQGSFALIALALGAIVARRRRA